MTIERDREQNQRHLMSRLGKYGRVLGITGLMAAAQFAALPRAGYTPYAYAAPRAPIVETEEDIKWQNELLAEIDRRIDRDWMDGLIERVYKSEEEVLKAAGKKLDLRIHCERNKHANRTSLGKAPGGYWFRSINEETEKGVYIGVGCVLVFPKKRGTGVPRLMLQTDEFTSKGVRNSGEDYDLVLDVFGRGGLLMISAYAEQILDIEREKLARLEPAVKAANPTDNLLGGSINAKPAGAIVEVMELVKKKGPNARVVVKNRKGQDVVLMPQGLDGVPDFYIAVAIPLYDMQ